MSAPIHEPARDDRHWWLGIASCVIAIVAIVAFYATTSVHFSFEWNSEGSGFGFNFGSSMDWWYHIVLIVLFVAGTVVGVTGGRRGSRGMKAIGWVGAGINAICAFLLAVFLTLAVYQGAFR